MGSKSKCHNNKPRIFRLCTLEIQNFLWKSSSIPENRVLRYIKYWAQCGVGMPKKFGPNLASWGPMWGVEPPTINARGCGWGGSPTPTMVAQAAKKQNKSKNHQVNSFADGSES